MYTVLSTSTPDPMDPQGTTEEVREVIVENVELDHGRKGSVEIEMEEKGPMTSTGN